jgi:hypothetical protein
MIFGVTKDNTLIIVDYKSTSKAGSITELSDSPWDQQYTRQLGVYRWLLEQNGFTVAQTGYLVYANASKDVDAFDDTLTFETTLVPVDTDTAWIVPTLRKIKTCLDSETLPTIGESCEFCPYREASGKKITSSISCQQKAITERLPVEYNMLLRVFDLVKQKAIKKLPPWPVIHARHEQ